MVTAVESDGSRSRLYPVPGEQSTWRVSRDGVCLGQVRREGDWFNALTAEGVAVPGAYPARSRAVQALEEFVR